MTIEAIKKEKKELEESIRKQINEFAVKYKIHVDDINIAEVTKFACIDGREDNFIEKIEIAIKL